MRVCIFSGRRFEEPFENTQWKNSNKCNQCDYDSSEAGNLRTHLKTHTGDTGPICLGPVLYLPKIDHAFSETGNLRTDLKTHTGDKSNKCNQCEYASSQAGHLRNHLKIHSGEKSNKCNQCDYAFSRQEIWGHNWKRTVEKFKQMQRMWLWGNIWNATTSENAQWKNSNKHLKTHSHSWKKVGSQDPGSFVFFGQN